MDTFDVRPCSMCDLYVASYGRIEVEREDPYEALAEACRVAREAMK